MPPINIGLRAHDYGRLPPEALSEALAAFRPDSIQLALSKAFPDAPGPGGLSPGYARRVRKALDARGIAVAVLGCYINPVHPDPDARDAQLRRFEEHLRYARDFGCPLVGTETGSRAPNCSFHPDTAAPETFDTLCASMERLARVAEACGAMIGVEPVACQHTLSSIEKMTAFLHRVPSPAIRIIWDPVNLIPPDGLGSESQPAFFSRALDAWGDRVAAVHAKDFVITNGRKQGDLPAGTGSLDWNALVSLLVTRKPGVDILLENAGPKTARAAMTMLRNIADEAGGA